MTRIFAQWQDRVVISETDAHHVVNVLRMQPGDRLELLIQENVYEGLIVSIKPLTIQRGKPFASHHELAMDITLIYPLSKGERMDWVIQKATELGVNTCIACKSDRTIVHWDDADLEKKFARYQRIIEEATLQSKREKVMRFDQYLPLSQALTLPFDHRFIASEYHQTLPRYRLPSQPLQGKIAIVVGPEGGFSEKELAFAIEQGYQPLSLGPSILRTETAVVTALAMVRDWR